MKAVLLVTLIVILCIVELPYIVGLIVVMAIRDWRDEQRLLPHRSSVK